MKFHPLVRYSRRIAAEDAQSETPLDIRTMLSTASKIGPADKVLAFNRSPEGSCCAERPSGIRIATDVCRARCYGWKTSEGRNGVLERAEKNDVIAQRADFVRLMVGAIRHSGVHWLRIHDLGDFDTVEYADAWYEIVNMLSDVHFWAYTRSWRDPDLLPALLRLASFPNMDLLFSWDRQTGTPPHITGIPWAWFADADGDPPPEKSLVVLRGTNERNRDEDRRRKAARDRGEKVPARRGRNVVLLKSMNGSPVCPLETGIPVKDKHRDCITCRRCMPEARKRTSR